mgnify:FL=1
MEIENIFKDINFKINPNIDYRKSYNYRLIKGFLKFFNKDKEYDFSNLLLSQANEDLDLKKALLMIESMSTYAIGYVINRICKNLSSNQLFLNIGVWKGFSLVSAMINTKCEVIGIDNFSQFDGPRTIFIENFNKYKKDNHYFYEQDYLIFFKNFEKNSKFIDFYFYDGEHSYENQYKNLEIADQFLKEGSIILIDDINFNEVYQGTMDFISKSNSKYKILKEIKTANNHCHPSYWNGIIILEKN